METLPGKEGLTILRRLIAYAEKIFQFSGVVVAGVMDLRQQPRIPASRVVQSIAALFWARLGSLNALELAAHSSFFRRWLGQPVCSADSVGRVTALMDAEGLRRGIHHIYDRLKRNKALPDQGGLGVAVLDGHESHASYRRHCPGCLERNIRTGQTECIQYYHRQVTLMLLPAARPGCDPVRFLLDHEPQRAGEDEVATALRLLERVIGSYPRGFDLVMADALYSTAPFFNFLLARGKHVLTVLKDDRRNLYQDAAALFAAFPPAEGTFRSRQCLWWDFPGLLSWPQVNVPVRVIRSQETRKVRRQLDGKDDTLTSDWIWVTTLPEQSVSTGRAVAFGHQRWDIGVSSQGHIVQSVRDRPGLKDSSLVAGEAPWRESKTAEPSDNILRKECAQRTRLQRAVNVDVASLHESPVAETVDNARKQQELAETSPIRQLSPAGYQRRHGVKDDVETGEALGVRRRNLAEEMPAITASGKCWHRHQGDGSGRSTADGRAAKPARREGPGPVSTPSVKVRQG